MAKRITSAQGREFLQDGRKLIIEIDLDALTTVSSSGKSRVVASARGNMPIPLEDAETIVVGLNAYRRI